MHKNQHRKPSILNTWQKTDFPSRVWYITHRHFYIDCPYKMYSADTLNMLKHKTNKIKPATHTTCKHTYTNKQTNKQQTIMHKGHINQYVFLMGLEQVLFVPNFQLLVRFCQETSSCQTRTC